MNEEQQTNVDAVLQLYSNTLVQIEQSKPGTEEYAALQKTLAWCQSVLDKLEEIGIKQAQLELDNRKVDEENRRADVDDRRKKMSLYLDTTLTTINTAAVVLLACAELASMWDVNNRGGITQRCGKLFLKHVLKVKTED